MKKVFFIINCYSKGGGAEALLTRIVNNLDETKYEIGIMEIIHDTVKVEPTKPHIKIYPYYVKADDPERKRKMYYVYHEWDKVIEEYIPQDYDLYVSFNYLKPSFLLPPGKKCIAWIHGDVYDLAVEDKQEERQLQKEAFKKANRIVTISDITTQSVIDLFPEYKDKIHIIYNGIDVEDVRKKSEEDADVELQHPAILSAGRLDANKNPLRLFEIFKGLSKRNEKAHLYYMGWGPLEAEVQTLTEENGLQDRVHLLGYKENPFPIMKQCDVIGMFSKSEGFPMTLLEGVALGKPFVSSIIGGARILANDQTCGRTVETNEDAVEALEYYLNVDTKEVEALCADSIKRFDMKQYIQEIEKLFDEVLES
ncbi:MAG: glycosyltransferase [Agathobacter sp.]|nr:glycosyltransferase [Agathobacter sp.]